MGFDCMVGVLSNLVVFWDSVCLIWFWRLMIWYFDFNSYLFGNRFGWFMCWLLFWYDLCCFGYFGWVLFIVDIRYDFSEFDD